MNSLQCSCCNFCVVDCNVAEYGQLSPCGPPAITDRGREATSPAKSEQSKNLWKHKAAFTDLRYYGIADTSCGPRVTDFHCSSLVTFGRVVQVLKTSVSIELCRRATGKRSYCIYRFEVD